MRASDQRSEPSSGDAEILRLPLRTRELDRDSSARGYWKQAEATIDVPADEVALLLCDVWDHHWCRGASERVDVMAPRIDALAKSLRAKGARVVHAPSDTMSFYDDHPARQRIRQIAPIEPPAPLDRPDPPLPIDASDNGSDTGETSWHTAWTRQHEAIEIDPERDVISDNGREIYSYLRGERISLLLIAGVHTNMCVLGRSFGIKQMVRWGVRTALVRDLTDTMYNPARSPYVDHDEGTRLVIEFIEAFWCPTVASPAIIET